MFRWLNKQGVESDKGYLVQRTGRFSSEYQEGSKKISITLDNGVMPNGRFCEIIKTSEFAKWNDGALIENEKQNEIINNYVEALNFQGLDVLIK